MRTEDRDQPPEPIAVAAVCDRRRSEGRDGSLSDPSALRARGTSRPTFAAQPPTSAPPRDPICEICEICGPPSCPSNLFHPHILQIETDTKERTKNRRRHLTNLILNT
jgi:hypothetical protein